MQHLGVISEVFGGLNFFLHLGFYFFLLWKSELIFKSPVATLLPRW